MYGILYTYYQLRWAKAIMALISGWFVGCIEDLRRFSGISVISRLSHIGSRRFPISEIQVARPGIKPRTSCSASQELNHYTTAAPSHDLWLSHLNMLHACPHNKGWMIRKKLNWNWSAYVYHSILSESMYITETRFPINAHHTDISNQYIRHQDFQSMYITETRFPINVYHTKISNQCTSHQDFQSIYIQHKDFQSIYTTPRFPINVYHTKISNQCIPHQDFQSMYTTPRFPINV